MHHRFQHFFGRHHGGRGFGHFGKGFMDGGDMGGRAFGMGRKLASPDLQLLLLGLLAEKPSHGYEIIKALDERSKGFYIPSPGMVYPALTYLEKIGHATVAVDGTRKLYSITDSGKEHLANNQSAADAMFAQFARVGERMDRVRRAINADAGGEEVVTDLIENTQARITQTGVATVDDVRRFPERLVAFRPEVEQERREAKAFLYKALYESKPLQPEKTKAEKVVTETFDFLVANPGKLPPSYQEKAEHENLARVVCDYIAGMTDHYVEDLRKKLLAG